MEHELKTLTARLLAQRWLPRGDKLVRRALVDETFRLELDRRLADVGLRLLDNPYAAHVGVALQPELAEPVFGAGARVRGQQPRPDARRGSRCW
jgi:hypothetical protein